jgi:hypothetical protein
MGKIRTAGNLAAKPLAPTAKNNLLTRWAKLHAALVTRMELPGAYAPRLAAENKRRCEKLFKDCGAAKPQALRLYGRLRSFAKKQRRREFPFRRVLPRILGFSTSLARQIFERARLEGAAEMSARPNSKGLETAYWRFSRPSVFSVKGMERLSYLLEGIEEALKVTRLDSGEVVAGDNGIIMGRPGGPLSTPPSALRKPLPPAPPSSRGLKADPGLTVV